MSSAFTEAIQKVVAAIPAGKVATYGLVAELAGHPRAARIVGCVMSKNNVLGLPCHRVVFRNGGLCQQDTFGLPGWQRHMLEQEKVCFLADGRVDLTASLWQPPEADSLVSHATKDKN